MNMPDRYEQLVFNLELRKAESKAHKQDIELIVLGPPEMDNGDTLKLRYQLSIEYWGDVVTKLKAIGRILADPGVVASVSTEELRHGTCIIQDVLTELAEVQQIIGGRE